MATFQCASCGFSREVPARLAGRRTKCPQCGVPGAVAGPTEGKAPASATSAFFACSSCGRKTEVPVRLVGRNAKCPSCGGIGTITAAPPKPADLEVDSISLDDLVQDAPPPPTPRGDPSQPLPTLAPDAPPPSEAPRLFQGNPLKNLFAGIVSGLLGVFFCLALAGLVFPQAALAPLYPSALGMALISAAVMGTVYATRSCVPFAIAGPESMACALLALMAGDVVRAMPGSPPETVFATAAVAVALSACMAGGMSWLAGRLRLGVLVRFIPTQIIGGVLAAVGVFLLAGAHGFVTGKPFSLAELLGGLSLEGLSRFLPDALSQPWTAAMLFGGLLFVLLFRLRHSLFLLLLLGLGVAAGLAGNWWPGSALARLADVSGFLPAGATPPMSLLISDWLPGVSWTVVFDQAPSALALVALLVMSDMSRITALEISLGRELDLDREFRILGLGNLAAGVCGGLPGAVSLGRSLGNRAAGAAGPLAGIVAALVCLAAFLHLGPWLGLVARFVPGGFLVYLGLSLLKDWLLDTRGEFTRKDDYALLWLTFVVTVVLGLLLGMAVGLVLAMLVTVSRYGRGASVGRVLSGDSHRSNVDRAKTQLTILREKGGRTLILELRGFLFLGSLQGVLRCVHQRLADRDAEPLRYVVLDFGAVTGLGSSVNMGFSMLTRLADAQGFRLVLAQLSLEVSQHLERAGLLRPGDEDAPVQAFMNLDYALEWCENRILEAEGALGGPEMSLADLLRPVFPDPEVVPQLLRVLKRVEVRKGQHVFRQGDLSDSLYFIESGMVNVELELEGGRILRLKKLGPGTVFGEMGLYTTAPRSASVVATRTCVLHRLSTESFRALQERAPRLASAVHRFVVTLLADHLSDANRKLRDLSRR